MEPLRNITGIPTWTVLCFATFHVIINIILVDFPRTEVIRFRVGKVSLSFTPSTSTSSGTLIKILIHALYWNYH
jgi:hypothetical protein